MISLLAPAALLGLSLLAIPVIVHLFQPRRVRQTPFSSLRWLHLTQQRLSRRIQWHQVLLFLLRAGFLTLLVLALAQPQWRAGRAGDADAQVAERFIVIDQSASMRYTEADGRTPFAEAQRFAEQLVKRGSPGDRTAVLLVGARATVLQPLDEHADAAVPELRQLAPTHEPTHLAAALPLVQSLASSRRPESQVKVYFVTDQQQQAWDAAAVQAFAHQLPGPASVHVIDVGAPAPRNCWIAATRLLPDPARQQMTLEVDVAASGDSFSRRVRLTSSQSETALEHSIELAPGGRQTVRFELALPPGADVPATALQVQLEPADVLPQDDRAYVLTGEPAAPRVLVVHDAAQALPPHLPTALKVLGASRRRLALTVRSTAVVTAEEIAHADAIVLLLGAALRTGLQQALTEQVQHGAGLLVFAGPGADPVAANASGLLPAQLATSPSPAPGADAPTTNLHWRTPALTQRLDPQVGDAGLVRITRAWRFAEPLPAGAQVLAQLDDGAPLVTASPRERGRVLTVLTDASDGWWDLPRRAVYLPFVDALLDELLGPPMPLRLEPGDAVALWLDAPTTPAADDAPPQLLSPSGEPLATTITRVGGRWRVSLPRVDEPGVYQWQGQPVLAVNPALSDADLTRLDGDVLTAMWEPLPVQVVQAPAERAALLAQQSRLSISPLLLVLACLLLLAEMYLVHKLCPRITPVVVTPLVRPGRGGRGFHGSNVHHTEAV